MVDAGIENITAYKITRQIMDHIYGSDEEMSERDFVIIHKAFRNLGGSWESLMSGDMTAIKVIEDVLESFVDERQYLHIATRIAAKSA